MPKLAAIRAIIHEQGTPRLTKVLGRMGSLINSTITAMKKNIGKILKVKAVTPIAECRRPDGCPDICCISLWLGGGGTNVCGVGINVLYRVREFLILRIG